MKRRIVLAFLSFLATGAVWVALRNPRLPTSSANDGTSVEDAPEVLARATEVRRGASSAEAENPDPDSEGGAVSENSIPPPAFPAPKPIALASYEEPPSGPDTGQAESSLPPAMVLENMRSAFRQYRLRFHENPVGDNAEITRALNGSNPRQVIFIQPDDGMRLNAHGELVDSWGTPYFFHQLSRTEMEIRSAGPDHRMWTTDDLALK